MEKAQKNRKILIIDDNELIHQDIIKVLVPRDNIQALNQLEKSLFDDIKDVGDFPSYRIDSAFQGLEGIEMVRKGLDEGDPYALAFIDIRMPPGIDGVETASRLWEIDRDLEVIFCTAYSDYSWADMYSDLKYNDRYVILKKPFDYIEVLQLALASTEKWNYRKGAALKMSDLEGMVEEKVRELKDKNTALTYEIEERKKIENALIRSERLAAIGTLTAGVAHEFNNIQTSVIGYLELSSQILNSDDDISVFKVYVDRAMNSSKRAVGITRKLLSFSSNKSEFRLVDVNKVVKNTIVFLENDFKTDGVDFSFEENEVSEVFADEEQLGQVALNLLINARHSLIQRQEKRIFIKTGTENGRVFFSVSDSGCGIPENELNSIFTPFYSTKGEHATYGSPQTHVRGSGLGLSISDTIIRNHNGEISVDSELDKGTVFTVWLPTVTDADRKTVELTERIFHTDSDGMEKSERKTGNILVVDDENDIREMLKDYLLRNGYKATIVKNGEEALEVMRSSSEQFDVVLLDMQMPKLTGSDFISIISREDVFNDGKIIAMTGKTFTTDIIYKSSEKIFKLLRKPFKLDDIEKVIQLALQDK